MRKQILTLALAFAMAGSAQAQGKPVIEKAADLPRFNYVVDGQLETLVRDPVAFSKFAVKLRHDVESVLSGYEIPDKATRRGLISILLQLDFLEGNYKGVLARADEIRALEEKPADKLLSGMSVRDMVRAEQATGSITSDAYKAEFGRLLAADLNALPYAVVENDIKGSNSRAQLIGESLVLGRIREVLQPTVDKSGSLSSDLAPAIVSSRFAYVAVLPLKTTLMSTYGSYLAAHKVEKADIWAARNVTLAPGLPYAPVNMSIWDSGVDTQLFPGRVVLGADGKPVLLAFDKYSNPSTGELMPIPADLQKKIPEMRSRSKGFSDLQSNIDSPEASEVKQFLSQLKPAEYKPAVEEIGLAGNYEHGTHVAGIATAGNPYARLVVARIEFGYTILPDPCPTREQAEKDARNSQAYVDFMKKNHVRVVNMSWGGSVLGYESDLETCGMGKNVEDRKAIAREYFDLTKNALKQAFASAPEILFVAAAGNSNSDASFVEDIPADIVLPNLITVGAVDKAGDEAPFTSYGPTVVVDANGYQVDSVIPGGDHLALSGTSMASPQVANLAGKMLAVNPKLSPVDLIRIIKATADKSDDGRRNLINPVKAIAMAQAS